MDILQPLLPSTELFAHVMYHMFCFMELFWFADRVQVRLFR